MKNFAQLSCLIALCISLVACAGTEMKEFSDYGTPMPVVSKEAVPLKSILADVDKYNGKSMLIKGEVTKVCAKKGCWLEMAADGKAPEDGVFVKFTCPVDGRLIPMEAVGNEVIVAGTITVEKVSEEEARHYAEDGNASAAEIAKIVGEQVRVRIASPGARIIGLAPMKQAESMPTSQPK